MKLICNKSHIYKTLRLYVNYTYNVVATTEEYFLLNEGLEEKKLIANRKLINTVKSWNEFTVIHLNNFFNKDR
jgi:hypothetical protein